MLSGLTMHTFHGCWHVLSHVHLPSTSYRGINQVYSIWDQNVGCSTHRKSANVYHSSEVNLQSALLTLATLLVSEIIVICLEAPTPHSFPTRTSAKSHSQKLQSLLLCPMI